MTLGSIVVRLSMATADFETDAGRASKVAQKRAKEIDAAFKKAGVAIGLALGAAMVGATAAIKGAIDKMDDLSKASQRVGLPTEEFSRLAYAGSLADVGVDTLVSTLGKLTKAQAAAYNETSQQAKVFDALGIAAFDAAGNMRTSTDVLADFADRFNQMQGSPEIMAAGFALFGRSFQDMIPLLKDGAEGIRSAAEEADRLGITLSTQAGKDAEQFNDDLTRLQTAMNGVWMEIANQLMPTLLELSGLFVDSAGKSRDLGETFGWVGREAKATKDDFLEFARMLDDLYVIVTSMTTGVQAMGSAMANALKLDFSGAIAEFKKAHGLADIAYSLGLKGKPDFSNVKGNPVSVNFAGIDADPGGMFKRTAAEAKAAKLAAIDAKKLQDALGNVTAPKGGSKGKAAGGKSDAAREAEEAKRAYEDAMRAQNSWHDSILDMAATLAGPVAQVNREYESNIAKLAADYDAGKVALKDYATAQELYAEVRDRDIKAIEARKGPAQQLLEDMQFEMELLGKTREQQELMTAARYLGVEAMTAEGKAALAKMAAFQQADEASRKQIELMDQFRDGATKALTDFVTGAATAEEALKSFVASMAAAVAQAIAQQWIKQLFGGNGTNDAGSAGGWLALVAKFMTSGYAGGGYTGAGGVNEYAGPVHKGEVVWSQSDVARAGGVSAVESARMSGGGTGGGSRKPQRIVIVDNQKDGEAMLRSSTGEDAILVHIGNNARAVRELLA